jgi:hypothetical protein
MLTHLFSSTNIVYVPYTSLGGFKEAGKNINGRVIGPKLIVTKSLSGLKSTVTLSPIKLILSIVIL